MVVIFINRKKTKQIISIFSSLIICLGCLVVPITTSAKTIDVIDSVAEPSIENSQITNSDKTFGEYRVTSDTLNVRNAANSNGQIIGIICKDETYEILDVANNWGKIRFSSSYGWVCMEYMKSVSTQNPQDQSITSKILTPNKITNIDPNYKNVSFKQFSGRILTDSERALLENIVYGEFGEDYTGCVYIAQCLRDAIVYGFCQNIMSLPVEFGYDGYDSERTYCSQEAINAIKYVFDDGGCGVQHRMLIMYNPTICASPWHESQEFVLEYVGSSWGSVRFFDMDGNYDYEPTQPTDPGIPDEKQPGKYKVTADTLNIRSTNAIGVDNIIGFAYENEIYSVVDVKDGWGKININSTIGWISLEFCEYLGAIEPFVAPPGFASAYLGTGDIVIRETASSSSKIIRTIEDTDVIKVEETSSGKKPWSKIICYDTFGNMFEGYFYGRFVFWYAYEQLFPRFNDHNFVFGDLSNDGSLGINDASILQRYLVEYLPLPENMVAIADIDGNGSVTIGDATKIQRICAELEND